MAQTCSDRRVKKNKKHSSRLGSAWMPRLRQSLAAELLFDTQCIIHLYIFFKKVCMYVCMYTLSTCHRRRVERAVERNLQVRRALWLRLGKLGLGKRSRVAEQDARSGSRAWTDKQRGRR